jgi:hypothetical protein
MRIGGPTFKDGPVGGPDATVLDWLNLPEGTKTASLDISLHDAHVISTRSDLIQRTMKLSCDIKHLLIPPFCGGLPVSSQFSRRAIGACISICDMAR